MQSNDEWLAQFSSQIGQGIDTARKGKSDQWISDRTARFGDRISRTAISEYRRGKRKAMPVTDLFQIAAALGVPPVTLLFPGLPDSPVLFLPSEGAATALDVLFWVTGERRSIPVNVDLLFDMSTGEPMGEVEGLREYRLDPATWINPLHDSWESGEKSTEYELLESSREIAHTFAEYNSESESFNELVKTGGDKWNALLKAQMNHFQELNDRIKVLEQQIQELGGVIQDETITQYEDEE